MKAKQRFNPQTRPLTQLLTNFNAFIPKVSEKKPLRRKKQTLSGTSSPPSNTSNPFPRERERVNHTNILQKRAHTHTQKKIYETSFRHITNGTSREEEGEKNQKRKKAGNEQHDGKKWNAWRPPLHFLRWHTTSNPTMDSSLFRQRTQ